MQSNGQIYFFHSIRHLQRYITGRLKKSCATIRAAAVDEIRRPDGGCPLRVDALVFMKDFGGNNGRFGKSYKHLLDAKKIISVEGVGVIVETCHDRAPCSLY